MTDPTPIEPDAKDWTVVLTDGCAECGFTPQDPSTTGDLLRGTVERWRSALYRDDARRRPQPTTWSALEYGCHVRDVCVVFRERLQLMLTEDSPEFPNFDQDEVAVRSAYHLQDPAVVANALASEAAATADAFDAVADQQWERKGLRGGGAHFTVATLAQYFWHDVHHHLHDVAA